MKKLRFLLYPVLMMLLAACMPASAPDSAPLGGGKTPASESTLSAPAASQPGATQNATPAPPQDIGSMVSIPAGTFQMGCDPAHNAGQACNDKKGIGADLHSITLDAYQIDKYEVTNAGYARCVAAGVCSAPTNPASPTRPDYYGNPDYADYPVMNVSWDQASAYCAWAGKRLPSEAEWEKAGRGSSETRLYPWGDQVPTCNLAAYGGPDICASDTAMVGTHPAGASPYGVQDMAGNVREWVADWWYSNYSLLSATLNPLGPVSGEFKVNRGGDWNSSDLGVAQRGNPTAGPSLLANNLTAVQYVGFRCAASGEGGSGVNPPGPLPAPTAAADLSTASPEPGKANAVGRVLWDGKPVAGTKVELCQGTSSESFGGIDCQGLTSSVKTDEQGIYHFLSVPAGQYVVMAHAIDTDSWFFFQRVDPNNPVSLLNNAPTPVDLSADQTQVFADMVIYKSDLKLSSPDNEDVLAQIPTLTWEAYPDAAYYGVTLGFSGTAEKILGTSLKLLPTLQNCDYPWRVDAYNSQGDKIAETWNWSTFHLVGQAGNCVTKLISPAVGAKLQAGQSIQFSWQPNPQATDYEVYISDASSNFNRVTEANYTLTEALAPGSHDWQITVFSNNERIASSDYGHFDVVDNPSANPAPATPPPAAIRDNPLVLIPAGPFQMGGNKCMVMGGGVCYKWEPGDDDPPHTVSLDAFKINAYEVTNAQYAACVAAGMCRPLRPGSADTPGNHYGVSSYENFPVTGVSWYDARAYCAWTGGRLPSEAEWEKAARGGLTGKMYPWGDTQPVCDSKAKNGAQSGSCRPRDTVEVGSYGSNGYGLFDMAGNVAEFVNDWYQKNYYKNGPASNPTGPDRGDGRVIRGGSYEGTPNFRGDALSVYVRGYSTPSMGFWSIGFRCAADVGE